MVKRGKHEETDAKSTKGKKPTGNVFLKSMRKEVMILGKHAVNPTTWNQMEGKQ